MERVTMEGKLFSGNASPTKEGMFLWRIKDSEGSGHRYQGGFQVSKATVDAKTFWWERAHSAADSGKRVSIPEGGRRGSRQEPEHVKLHIPQDRILWNISEVSQYLTQMSITYILFLKTTVTSTLKHVA